jgi:putative transposase
LNYWDYCPRDQKDYHARLNYLLYNPVKHGYVSDLKDYPQSSFQGLFQALGKERLAEQIRDRPDFRMLEVMGDDF